MKFSGFTLHFDIACECLQFSTEKKQYQNSLLIFHTIRSVSHVTLQQWHIKHKCGASVVSYRIDDFFDPTHFDRTTDFPHFGLCVRAALRSSTIYLPESMLLSLSPLCFHNLGCFACNTDTHTHTRLNVVFFGSVAFFPPTASTFLSVYAPLPI